METRVCRLHGKLDVRVESEPVGEPEAGQVRVNVAAGGICGSDLHYYLDGGFGPIRVQQPIILGHEASGVVESLGAGVTALQPGDRVALNPSHPCGQCEYCQKNQPNHCLEMRFLGSALRYPHEQGCFREQLVINAEQCHKLAEPVSLAEGACAEPLSIAVHARNRAGDLSGKKVLVTGAGPIGSLCVAVIRQAGAAEIVVTDLQDATLAIAEQMGATRTINVQREPEAIDPYLAGKGYFDVVFECSAAAPALKTAIAALKPLGTLMQVGVTGDTPIPINMLVGKEINWLGAHRFIGEFAEAVALLNSGEIDVKPIITDSFPMDQVGDALQTAGDRSRSSKVQVTFL
ncbi:MAG: L-idonate 5-dehydrogenase [Thiolinea sp.]